MMKRASSLSYLAKTDASSDGGGSNTNGNSGQPPRSPTSTHSHHSNTALQMPPAPPPRTTRIRSMFSTLQRSHQYDSHPSPFHSGIPLSVHITAPFTSSISPPISLAVTPTPSPPVTPSSANSNNLVSPSNSAGVTLTTPTHSYGTIRGLKTEEVKRNIDVAEHKRIQVFVRVRPFNQRETERGQPSCVRLSEDSKSLQIVFKSRSSNFAFDHIISHESQQDVFDKFTRPVCDKCIEGFNGTIFAYGQTGSGKTYTMVGSTDDYEARGLMPRVLEYMFNKMKQIKEQSNGDTVFECKVSFVEIYNDRIYDLLTPENEALQLRERSDLGVYVERLTELPIESDEDAWNIVQRGNKNRTVGCTQMNRESSRSHSILTLSIQSVETGPSGNTIRKSSRFNLIDLAGSERQDKSGTSGVRLAEASSINQSLSALGNVIDSLVAISNGKQRHIPYRDSKLTFLLKDSLGGNSLTYIMVCISPAFENLSETVSSLKFAQRAKRVKIHAKVNEQIPATLSELRKENLLLRQMIEKLSAKANNKAFLRSNSNASISVYDDEDDDNMSVISLDLNRPSPRGVFSFNEELFHHTLAREQECREQLEVAQKELKLVKEQNEKLSKQQQSNMMVLNLREGFIESLKEDIEKLRKQAQADGEAAVTPSDAENMLRAEVERLKKERAVVCHFTIVKIQYCNLLVLCTAYHTTPHHTTPHHTTPHHTIPHHTIPYQF